jgi:hypothetical protein
MRPRRALTRQRASSRRRPRARRAARHGARAGRRQRRRRRRLQPRSVRSNRRRRRLRPRALTAILRTPAAITRAPHRITARQTRISHQETSQSSQQASNHDSARAPRSTRLIPPPRHPLVRFHGAFAPRSSWRKLVVPKARPHLQSHAIVTSRSHRRARQHKKHAHRARRNAAHLRWPLSRRPTHSRPTSSRCVIGNA